MKIKEKLTYYYLRKVKKWMFCPSCNEPELKINKSGTEWNCEHCGYALSNEEFENDYVFWFCDQCGAYLNIQEGFNYYDDLWICSKCECLNDISSNNLTGICKYCGIILENPERTICTDCTTEQKYKIQYKATFAKKIGSDAETLLNRKE